MTNISDIVQIDITRETAAVTQTNFEVPLFIAIHSAFPERARTYASLTAVSADFPAGSPVYKAAQGAFGQTIKPDTLVIGRRTMTNTTVTPVVPANATVGLPFIMTINGTAYTTTFAANDTATLIATKLATAYAATAQTGITVTATAGVLTVTPTTNTVLKIGLSTNLTQGPATSVEDIVAAYQAVKAVNNTFYLVTTDSRDEDEIEALADTIEAEKKIYGASILPTDAGTTSTTDLLSRLKAKSLFRTYVLVSTSALTEFGELAWGAYQIQEQAGSNTWAYKTLSTISTSDLTEDQALNIASKNGNTYEAIGGLSLTNPGKTVGGEWIDVMVFVDWLEARMRERIFFRLANSKKLPYTAAGAAIIETEIRAQLREGIRVGGLADTPAPVVFVPDVLTISANIRAQRVFEGITFNARLAGAIHIVKIQGTVTI